MDNRELSPDVDDQAEIKSKISAFITEKLPKVVASPRAASEPEREKHFDDARRSEEKHRARQFKNDRLKQDMDLREKHAERAVGLAQIAVGCWLALFLFSGAMNLTQGRVFLSDQALITLTAGATVNVIAVFLVVVKGLFPSPGPLQKKRKKLSRASRKNSNNA